MWISKENVKDKKVLKVTHFRKQLRSLSFIKVLNQNGSSYKFVFVNTIIENNNPIANYILSLSLKIYLCKWLPATSSIQCISSYKSLKTLSMSKVPAWTSLWIWPCNLDNLPSSRLQSRGIQCPGASRPKAPIVAKTSLYLMRSESSVSFNWNQINN